MAGFIFLAAVGFGLGNALTQQSSVRKPAHNDLAYEVACHIERSAVKEFRRIAVAPGEMEHVSLPPALFDGAENVEISVVREG